MCNSLRMLKWLRMASLADGISFLVLLYFSIYEKRILGNAEAIRIPGMIHGGIFCIFCVLLLQTWIARSWSIKRAALVFLCALIPFAPFWMDVSLRREEKNQ